MAKDKTKKKDYEKDVFQENPSVDDILKDKGENPPASSQDSGDDVANSAKKLKARIAISPVAPVSEHVSKMVDGDGSEADSMTRSAAGFGGTSKVNDTSRIPYRNKANRSDTPYGKKNSVNAHEIDDVASEFIIPEVDDAIGLKDKPTADQQYNGRKKFVKERAKKNDTTGPQGFLYNSSADLDISSFIIPTCGQMVGDIPAKSNYPLQDIEGNLHPIPMRKSNYVLERFRLKLTNGKISRIEFVETQTPVHVNEVTVEQSNFHWQIDRNNVVKAMNKLQLQYGHETKEDWSPMGYAIEYPYEHNMLLHDIEATTGAISAIAYRAAVSSTAFQHNITIKDGKQPQAAAVRMFIEGCLGSLANSECVADKQDIPRYVFNKEMYRRGSAAAMIAMFDSVRKFVNKSSFLQFPTGLGKCIEHAGSHYKPLRVKPDFMKVLDKAHMCSTMDGTYSPLLPVYTTRKINIINPLSLNFFLKDWKHPSVLQSEMNVAANDSDPKVYKDWISNHKYYDHTTGLKAQFGYAYREQNNRFVTKIQHPIVGGIVRWLLEREGKLASVYGSNAQIDMPCAFDFMNPSMFQMIICSAMSRICEERKDPLRDVFANTISDKYLWEDLKTLDELDPLKSTQMKINGHNAPIDIGKLSTDTKFRLLWGSSFSPLKSESNNKVSYLLPWYMSDRGFATGTNAYADYRGYFDADNYAQMNIPSVRRGINHSYVDMVHDVDPSQLRLSLDRYLDVPGFTEYNDAGYWRVVNRIGNATDLGNTDNVSLSTIKYDRNTDGRMAITYKTDQSILPGGIVPVNEYSILTIPKELGWIWDSIPSMVPVIKSISATTGDTDTITVEYYRDNQSVFDNNMSGGTAREVRSYRVIQPASNDIDIIQGAALWQGYYTAYADWKMYQANNAYTNNIGIVLDLSYSNHGYQELPCFYIPKSDTHSSSFPVTKFASNAKSVWSFLQRVFIPINPFYNCYDNLDTLTSEHIMVDPMENSFYFGFCGMVATDYMQAVRERLNLFEQLDTDYTEDVYAKKSLLLQ